MKISLLVKKIPNSLQIGFAAIALASLSACASNSWTKQADSSLPMEAIHSGSGAIMNFRAYETSDRLYVAGIAKPHQLMQPTHVDIQLVGPDGRILAERADDLDSPMHPRIVRGRSGSMSYVASFPLSEARQAAKIRVIYHSSSHSKGNS